MYVTLLKPAQTKRLSTTEGLRIPHMGFRALPPCSFPFRGLLASSFVGVAPIRFQRKLKFVVSVIQEPGPSNSCTWRLHPVRGADMSKACPKTGFAERPPTTTFEMLLETAYVANPEPSSLSRAKACASLYRPQYNTSKANTWITAQFVMCVPVVRVTHTHTHTPRQLSKRSSTGVRAGFGNGVY